MRAIFGFSVKKEGNVSEKFSSKGKIILNKIKKERKITGEEVFIKPQHSDKAVIVDGRIGPVTCDAAITKEKEKPLLLATADCLPVFILTQGSVALVHAGRKGTQKNILYKTLVKLVLYNHHLQKKMQVFFGPCIGPCCYSVDLWAENIKQAFLFAQKEPAWEIKINNKKRPECTCCAWEGKDYLFFSHARKHLEEGRNLAYIIKK